MPIQFFVGATLGTLLRYRVDPDVQTVRLPGGEWHITARQRLIGDRYAAVRDTTAEDLLHLAIWSDAVRRERLPAEEPAVLPHGRVEAPGFLLGRGVLDEVRMPVGVDQGGEAPPRALLPGRVGHGGLEHRAADAVDVAPGRLHRHAEGVARDVLVGERPHAEHDVPRSRSARGCTYPAPRIVP